MPKTSISSLELAALVNELQVLVKGKIAGIYQFDKEFLFQLHLQDQGKQFLRLVPGKFLCLTKKKESAAIPTEFCRQLRRHLEGGILKSLSQKESERIVVMDVEKKEKYQVIIELFSKGNLVVTDKEYRILLLLEQQEWKDRTIKRGGKYHFPKPGADWKALTEAELSALLQRSEKRNLVTALATDLGLGGLYAEELCAVAGVDKNTIPAALISSDVKSLQRAVQKFLDNIKQPHGNLYDGEITPFPLKSTLKSKNPAHQTVTYNEAIDTLTPFPKISPYEKKITAWQQTIQQQEQAIAGYEQSLADNTRKGEAVYEHYAALQKLLDTVKQWRLQKSWEEIAAELRKLRKIKQVNLKEKKVMVEL